jgi:hypothetical protein
MNFRPYVILPFVAALVPALITLAMGSSPSLATAFKMEVFVVRIMALTAALVAANAFDRGDYMQRAWLIYGLAPAFIMIRDLLFTFWLTRESGTPSEYVEALLVFLANAGQIVGVWMLSRAWQIAGIELPGSSHRRALFIGIGTLIGIAVTGPSMALNLGDALRGEMFGLVALISGIGDIVSFALIVPVVLTAIAMRGGLLFWPWGLLTASLAGWLLCDLTGLLRHIVEDAAFTLTWRETFRTLACAFCLSAGIAQHAVNSRDIALP